MPFLLHSQRYLSNQITRAYQRVVGPRKVSVEIPPLSQAGYVIPPTAAVRCSRQDLDSAVAKLQETMDLVMAKLDRIEKLVECQPDRIA